MAAANETVIEGTFVLEGVGGGEVTERQFGKLRWTTYDTEGRWEISFATSHQFHLPDGEAREVWVRFDDTAGRTLLRQHQGVQQVVTLPATAGTIQAS